MAASLICISHSPLKGLFDPALEVIDETNRLILSLSKELEEFDPELIFLFAPDHYNGFFLDSMPQICVGIEALSIGDYGGLQGPLNVPSSIALELSESLIDDGFDIAVSFKMTVDHGFEQPLRELIGDLTRFPVIPIFINSVAPPMISFKRARLFGEALGRFAAKLNKRILFLGSGGLSHNPPVPLIHSAPAEVAARIINGRNPSQEAVQARKARTVSAAIAFAKGESDLHPLSPDWDLQFIENLVTKDWKRIDEYSNTQVTNDAGASAHESKTWVVASAAMNACCANRYEPFSRYYRAIPEWIAGYGALTAVDTTEGIHRE